MNIGSTFTRASVIVSANVTNEWLQERLNAGVPRGIEDGITKTVGFVPFDAPDRAEHRSMEHARGEYTVFRFVRLRKRVPAAALRMRINQETERAKSELGRNPGRGLMQEIHERVFAQMMDQAFPCPSGFPVIWHTRSGMMLLGSASAGLIDDFLALFEKVFQLYPAFQFHSRWAMSVLAGQSKRLRDKLKALFQWEAPLALQEARSLGNDFLTWLWYYSEREARSVALPDGSEAQIQISDKVTLLQPDAREERVICTSPKGQLAEAREALRRGKLVESTALWIGIPDREYSLVFDSTLLAWRSMRLPHSPPDHEADLDGLFLERMSHIETIRTVLDTLYLKFLQERLSPNWDRSIQALMRDWFARTEEAA